MNVKQLKKFIPHVLDKKLSLMIVGNHGQAKSSTVKQYAKENGLGFIDRRLSQMESGDLLGLPDLSNGRTTFATPDWLPTDPSSKGILFLDELNRARPDVLQAVFQLALDRQLGAYHLPEGWHVITAVNPNTDNYSVTTFEDEALKDRFVHVKLQLTDEEFLEYASVQEGIDPDMINFYRNRPELLMNQKLASFSIDRKPSHRSSLQAMFLAKDLPDELFVEGVGGLIGIENAVIMKAYLENNRSKPFTAEQILNEFKKIESQVREYVDMSSGKSRHDLITQSLDNIIPYLTMKKATTKQVDNLIQFLQIIPKDISTAHVKNGCSHVEKDIKEFYLNKILDDERTDSMFLSREKDADGKDDYDRLAEMQQLVDDLIAGKIK